MEGLSPEPIDFVLLLTRNVATRRSDFFENDAPLTEPDCVIRKVASYPTIHAERVYQRLLPYQATRHRMPLFPEVGADFIHSFASVPGMNLQATN